MTSHEKPSDNDDQAIATKSRHLQLRLAGALDILFNAAKNFRINGDINQAAAISLFSLLSLVPLLILTLLVIGYLVGASSGRQETLLGMMGEFYPLFSQGLFTKLGEIEEKRRLLGTVGIISLFWLASLVISTIEISLNIIFRSQGRRNYFVSVGLAIGMISVVWVVSLVMILISIAHTMATIDTHLMSWLMDILPTSVRYLLGYAIPYLTIAAIVSFCYKIIPKNKVSFGSALVGGVIFTLLMVAAKTVFTWYIVNYAHYSAIYGSLDVVVIMAIGIFYLAVIFLFCAEIVSSYQRRDFILLEDIMLKHKTRFRKTGERLYRKFGRIYEADSFIFKEGETDRDLFYILNGHVQIEKKSSGTTQVLARMGPGEYVGEIAALIDLPRSASARVTETAAIAVIPEKTFSNVLRENEELALFMLRELSHRLVRTNTILDELSQSWFKLMIIAYFCVQSTMSLKDREAMLAELVRLTGKGREEVDQALLRLEEEGVVTMKGAPGFNKEMAWQILVHGIR